MTGLEFSRPRSAILCRGLSRRFGSIQALEGLDLDVPSGSLCAMVGPNGAGKSTAVRVFCGLIKPDEGRVSVVGLDPIEDAGALRRVLGVVPDFPVLFEILTPRENLHRLAALRGLPSRETASRLDELAEAMDIGEQLDRPFGGLSVGTRKKATLLAAMIHAPRILFLDEPFEGIDPLSCRTIRTMLDRLRARGVTIFLTSHVLPVVETLATHVAILDSGRLVVTGPTEEIVGGHANLESAVLDRLGVGQDVPELAWYVP